MYCPALRIVSTKIMHIGEEANISFLKCYKKLAHTYFTPEDYQALLQDGHKEGRGSIMENEQGRTRERVASRNGQI